MKAIITIEDVPNTNGGVSLGMQIEPPMAQDGPMSPAIRLASKFITEFVPSIMREDGMVNTDLKSEEEAP